MTTKECKLQEIFLIANRDEHTFSDIFASPVVFSLDANIEYQYLCLCLYLSERYKEGNTNSSNRVFKQI